MFIIKEAKQQTKWTQSHVKDKILPFKLAKSVLCFCSHIRNCLFLTTLIN